MNISKTISTILGYFMLILYGIWTLFFYAGMWGGIGFFGAILTFPFSVMISLFLIAFSNFGAFIICAVWLSVSILLITLGSNE
jgi:hypothetical protein